MKKIIAWILCLALLISAAPFAVLADDADIEIATYADLVAWAENGSDDAGKTVRLIADIVANAGTAASFKVTAPANVWNGKNFAGTFDGQGHSISGLYNNGNGGLVKDLTGTVKNLYLLESCIIATSNGMGFVANGANGATVQNVYVNGYMSCANFAGGIVGNQRGALTVISCWFDGEIEATGRYIAGISGNQSSKALTVTDCLNTGKISTTSTEGDISGISGGTYSGSLIATRCVNTGRIAAPNGARPTGGITQMVENAGVVRLADCYSIRGAAAAAEGIMRTSICTFEGEALDVDSIADIPELAGWTDNVDGIPVPQYFAGVESKHPNVETEITYISTYQELINFVTSSAKNRVGVLTQDISSGNTGNAADWIDSAPSVVWNRVAFNYGVLDGNGHTLSGIYVEGAGMFTGMTYSEVRNLRLVNSAAKASGSASILVGTFGNYARFNNVYTDAVVSGGASSGGFASTAGTVGLVFRNCWFDGTFTASGNWVSAFMGQFNCNSTVQKQVAFIDCINTGSVSGASIVAGFNAANYKGYTKAIRCVNAGPITSTSGPTGSAAFVCVVNSDAATATNPITGTAVFTDCYNLRGTVGYVEPYDVRGVSVVDGNISGMDSLEELLADPAYSGWVKINDDLVVPGCFADVSATFTKRYPANAKFIGTAQELTNWASASAANRNGVVVLTDDITLNSGNAEDWLSSAPSIVWPIFDFLGTFDGQGHTISGLYSSASGMFNSANFSVICNLRLINSAVNASDNTAGIVYSGNRTTIENIYTDVIVNTTSSTATGGIIGTQGGPVMIRNTWFNGKVIAATGRYVGGIIGNQQSNVSTLSDVLNTGMIKAEFTVAGISDAVYQGAFYGTRVVNGGKVYAINNNGSAVVDIVSANNRAGGIAEFTDVYAVKCSADFVGIRDKRTSGVTGSSVTGTVNVIGSLSELNDNSAFSGWATNADGVKVPAGFAQYAIGDNGYEPAIIEIGDYEALLAWAASTTNVYDNVVLTDDITVDADTYGAWSTKNYFKGFFDGQGYSITGLTDRLVNSLSNATFADVSLIDSATVGSTRGAFAQSAYGCNAFYNCYVSGSLTGGNDSVGGFIGQILSHAGTAGSAPNSEAFFKGCWSDVDITISNRYASGFVGNNQSQNATFEDCLFTGSITTTAPGDTPIIAGFSASSYNGVNSYTNCLYAGTMSFGGTFENNAGGALGFRAYKATQETYVNNYALDNGTFKYLMNESEGEDPDTEGKIALIQSSELASVAASLGSGWGTDTVNGVKMAVPKAIASFTYGDLNNSGNIDTVDFTLLRQYLADSSTVIELDAADVNGSGEIDTVDLTLLCQYLADNSTVLGPQA